MQTDEENRLLTEIGPGTPMGELLRQYWIPFLPSADLELGGKPVRVRLFGEDLVAFRKPTGEVGLIGAACSHRSAAMAFARNDNGGLQCVYHGWTYDECGRCIDMPNEIPASKLRLRIRQPAYQCRERNGVVWCYMAAHALDANPPELPEMEWNQVPDSQVIISMRVQECNWLQALEGDIDSTHGRFLHARIDHDIVESTSSRHTGSQDRAPIFETMVTDFGVMVGAKRKTKRGTAYWRVNQFVMPFWTLVPPKNLEPDLSGHAWVPIDDTHTLSFMFSYVPVGEISEKKRKLYTTGRNGREPGHATKAGMSPRPGQPFENYWTKWSIDNDYEIDWELQESTWFSGLPGLWIQDAAVQCGVSPIVDRTRENLGASDSGIMRTRTLLLESAVALRDKHDLPPTAVDPELYHVRAVGIELPVDENWIDAISPFVTASGDYGYDIPV